jgi:hypothetical protein
LFKLNSKLFVAQRPPGVQIMTGSPQGGSRFPAILVLVSAVLIAVSIANGGLSSLAKLIGPNTASGPAASVHDVQRVVKLAPAAFRGACEVKVKDGRSIQDGKVIRQGDQPRPCFNIVGQILIRSGLPPEISVISHRDQTINLSTSPLQVSAKQDGKDAHGDPVYHLTWKIKPNSGVQGLGAVHVNPTRTFSAKQGEVTWSAQGSDVGFRVWVYANDPKSEAGWPIFLWPPPGLNP